MRAGLCVLLLALAGGSAGAQPAEPLVAPEPAPVEASAPSSDEPAPPSEAAPSSDEPAPPLEAGPAPGVAPAAPPPSELQRELPVRSTPATTPRRGAEPTPTVLAELAATTVSGYAQIDYLRKQISLDELADGSGEPLNEDRFLIRHARLKLQRDWRYVGLSSETELFAGGSSVRPVAFEIHARLPDSQDSARPRLQLRAGLFPVAFGFENYQQTDSERFFGERSLFVHGLVPGRFDLGAALSGHLWNLEWIAAVYNGEPLESGTFAYEDPNAAKDVVGRARATGELVAGVRAAGAISLLYGHGFSPGTPPTKDSFEWRDLNEDGRVIQSELVPIPGSAGRPSANYERWGLGADVQVWTDLPHLGELFVYGEVALAVNLDRAIAPADPVLLGRDQRGLGFYLAATLELTEHATVGVRVEQYEPNADALELFDGITVITRRRFRTVTAGAAANLHMSSTSRARLLLEYDHQQNSLGRDNRGRPAQLDNDTLRLRMEIVF